METEYYKATPADEKYWTIGENDEYSAKIADGYYVYLNKKDNTAYVPLVAGNSTSSILDVTGNFYYEVEAKVSSATVANPSSGIAFSNYTSPDKLADPLHFMYGSNKQLIGIGENSCIALFIQLYSELFKPDEFNKYAIRKNGDTLYYYINDSFLYYNDLAGIPVNGSSFGFTVGGNCEFAVKDALIKTSGTSKRAPFSDGGKPQPIDLGPSFATEIKSY